MALGLCTPAQARDTSDAPFRAFDEGRYAEALRGAEAGLANNPESAVWWALAAEAQAKLGQHDAAAHSFSEAAGFEGDDARRSYFLRGQAYQLVLAGRHAAARELISTAIADTALGADDSLDWALVAISAGDDATAQDILDNEDLHALVTRQSALDAGYSAKRQGLDGRAVRFFTYGLELDAQHAEPLGEVQREAIRRENRELTRDWSFLAQEAFSSAGRPIGPSNTPLGDARTLQFGAEAARRFGGWRNGRPVSLFARVFHSEFLSGDALSDRSTQGWLGVRYKPLAQLNLNLEASRLVALEDNALDDWSLRGAISGGRGVEPEVGSGEWLYAHYYADASYLIDADVSLALGEARAGYSFLLDRDQTVVTPYGVARIDLDTGRIEQEALGAGVGLSLRHWFDETDTIAYRGFIEFDVQARQRIAGARTATGLLATMTIGR